MGLMIGYEYKQQQYKRGEIYYIQNNTQATGSEIRKDRPAVIVSNDANNKFSQVLEVVYLTTQPKHDIPTHVTIRSTGRMSEALCEQPTPVSTERIGKYVGKVTDAEMESIEIALMIAMGIDMTQEQIKEMENMLTASENPQGGVLTQEKKEGAVMTEADEKELRHLRAENNNLMEEIQKLQKENLMLLSEKNTFERLYNGILKELIKKENRA